MIGNTNHTLEDHQIVCMIGAKGLNLAFQFFNCTGVAHPIVFAVNITPLSLLIFIITIVITIFLLVLIDVNIRIKIYVV